MTLDDSPGTFTSTEVSVPPYIPPYMIPASITIAVTGVIPNVSGSSNAMPAAGPIPGSAPMICPTTTPIRRKRRLAGSSAVAKPCARRPRESMAAFSSSLDAEIPGREIDVEPPDKDRVDHARRHGRRNQCGDERPPHQPVEKKNHEQRGARHHAQERRNTQKDDQTKECCRNPLHPHRIWPIIYSRPSRCDGSRLGNWQQAACGREPGRDKGRPGRGVSPIAEMPRPKNKQGRQREHDERRDDI